MRLPVCQALFGEHSSKNRPVVGNIVRAVAVRVGQSLGEGSPHHQISACVNGHVDALGIAWRVAFIVYEHMNALDFL